MFQEATSSLPQGADDSPMINRNWQCENEFKPELCSRLHETCIEGQSTVLHAPQKEITGLYQTASRHCFAGQLCQPNYEVHLASFNDWLFCHKIVYCSTSLTSASNLIRLAMYESFQGLFLHMYKNGKTVRYP